MSNRTRLDPLVDVQGLSQDLGRLLADPIGALDEYVTPPSAILTDGLIWVPLFAVSRLSLSQSYRLPPVGSSALRAVMGTSDDTVSLSALLIGNSRFLWKQLLELQADLSRRGGTLGILTGGAVSGLMLITRMVVRLDLQVASLTFTQSAQRRDAIEVSLSLRHVPRPGPQHLLVDVGMTALASIGEYAA